MWQVLQLPGGWLRYNAAHGRLDAHCRHHAGGCKMDRALKKGPIGLSMAWLGAKAGTKHEHDTLKETISSESGHSGRVQGRCHFTKMADKRQGLYKDVVEHEARPRGGDREEPVKIRMYVMYFETLSYLVCYLC